MVLIQKFFIFCQAWIISNKIGLPRLLFNFTLFLKLASKMPIPKDNSICQFLFGALVLQLSAIASRYFSPVNISDTCLIRFTLFLFYYWHFYIIG